MKLATIKKRLKGFGYIQNMQSPSYNGGTVANQYTIKFDNGTVFQSYDSIIAVEIRQKVKGDYKIVTYLTKDWDYSTTTGKYRNQFLGENKKETQAKIDNGTYKLLT